MGTSEFGIPCLNYLSERDDIDLRAIVTKPPLPSGRGRILKDAPIKQIAMKKGLKVIEPVDVKSENFIRNLKDLDPTLSIVAAFGKILPKQVLKIPGHGSINIHPSLLPLYRGPSPINWAIINGESETGVSSFFMEEGMDTGPIICQRATPIHPEEDSGMLEERLKNLAVEVLAETLDKVKNGKVVSRVQDSVKATLAPKITSKTGKIDWSCEGERISNLIRGLSPRPGAYTFFKRGRFINEPEDKAILVKIWKAGFLKGNSKGAAHQGCVGRVMEVASKGVKSKGLNIFSGKGIVLIQELQPAGKKKMDGKAFWSGYGC